MAKAQKRGNREAKKPKSSVKKQGAAAPTVVSQLTGKPAASKAGK